MKTLVVITGPTAVGKTNLCLAFAQHLGIPIINADSRQIYKELKIGTAAPTLEQQAIVKHYFVGNISIHDYYNVSMYEQEVLELLEHELFPNHHIALMTGGSMMYIDVVCHGIDNIPTVNAETRKTMKRRYEEEGIDRLCDELKVLDPAYYAVVDRKNHKRVIHALEICHMTGKPYTSFRTEQKKQRPFRIVKIGLNRERDELYHRIDQRVDQMMKDGLLDEVRGLYNERHQNALNTVGYKELFEYIDNRCSLDEAVERIKYHTHRYARKQLTWFKRDTTVRWFHPDEEENILNYISQYEH